jgi:hypothetical protein
VEASGCVSPTVDEARRIASNIAKVAHISYKKK